MIPINEHNNNHYGMVTQRLQQRHTYLSSSQQLCTCTLDPLNWRENMPATENITSYPGLVMSWPNPSTKVLLSLRMLMRCANAASSLRIHLHVKWTVTIFSYRSLSFSRILYVQHKKILWILLQFKHTFFVFTYAFATEIKKKNNLMFHWVFFIAARAFGGIYSCLL